MIIKKTAGTVPAVFVYACMHFLCKPPPPPSGLYEKPPGTPEQAPYNIDAPEPAQIIRAFPDLRPKGSVRTQYP